MRPKIVFLDLEGTLLRKEHRLDNGLVAPSAWTVLAERLGPEALREEEETKRRWVGGGYGGYLDWMRDTILIHQRHGLTREVFEAVVGSAEFTPGAREAVAEFRNEGTVTVLLSGGFKALSDLAQRELRIDHAFAACEYFFGAHGRLEHYNLLPSDEEGKLDFAILVARQYGVGLGDCAFVGDGKNDVRIAAAVGCSVSFNGQPELRRVASVAVEQDRGAEDFSVVPSAIYSHPSDDDAPGISG